MSDRAEWLAARRSGIGGSDVAALIGLSPYLTQYQLWLEKTGRGAPDTHDEAAIERMHFGAVLEGVVSAEFVRRREATVQRVNTPLQHPECSIAIANIDRAVVQPGSRARWDDKAGRLLGATALLECKTAHALAGRSEEWGEPGTADVPVHYWLQCQWYLGITGLPVAHLACLFGGQRFAIYDIEFSAADFAQLLERADRWWRAHVVADTPPDPASEAEARERWPRHAAGKTQIVDAGIASAVEHLRSVKAQIAELEEAEERWRDIILPAFGDAEAITHGGRVLATWKSSKDSTTTDWKAIVAELAPAPEVITRHTVERPGVRRFVLKETK